MAGGSASKDRILSGALLCLQNIRIVLPSLDLTRLNPFCESLINRLLIVVNALRSVLKTSAELRLENVALRHQLGILRRSAPKRLKMTATDRLVWVLLRRLWSRVYLRRSGT